MEENFRQEMLLSNTITETIQDEIPVWKEKSEKSYHFRKQNVSELQFVVSRIESEFSEDIFHPYG